MEGSSILPQSQQDNVMNKRQEIDTDRISSLSDDLLVQILSLVSMKEAVSTSLLGTRWRNLWAQVPNLVIKEEMFSTRSHFLDFVGRAMALRGQTSMKQFSLKCNVQEDVPVITNWIEMALRYNVQHLDLNLENTGSHFTLCPSIFESEILEKFELNSSCVLIIPSPKPLPNMKVLSLNKVMFVDDDSVTRLLACPSLLEMTLKRCKWRNLHRVHISAPKLQYLSIFDSKENIDEEEFEYEDLFAYDRRIEINGAFLKTFKYEGEAINEYKLSGVTRQLVEAIIHVSHHPDELNVDIVVPHISQLFSAVSEVQVLTVSANWLQDLAENEEDIKELPDFNLLTKLHINGMVDSLAFQGLSVFMRRCRCLSSLHILEFDHRSKYSDYGWMVDPFQMSFVAGLKEISISCIFQEEFVKTDIFILEQLMKHAIALEHMELHYRRDIFKTGHLKRRLAKVPVGSKGIKFSLFAFNHYPTKEHTFSPGPVSVEYFHIGN